MADGKIIIDTSLDSSGLEKGLSKLGGLAKTGAKAAVAAVGGVATALGGVAVAAGKVGMDFEAQMSRVQAISGATGDELKKLQDQAVELGAKTAFSALESAEGMENLASAGFNTQEILAAMPGMLDLAASSGEDLASSADIAASTLRGFGMEASQAGHVADVLAKNAADTNAAVADTGEAMKYIAPLAKAAGISMEETAAAIGIMADNGIKGGQAGTTLRGALSRLSKPTKDMRGAMEELGISFYDSEGKMLSLSDQISMLKKATAGLTDEQRNNYLVTLYGQESLSGMLALINTTDGKLEQMTQSYMNCDGAASEMAETMQDNLASAIEQVGGAAESFGITVYESIKDPLKDAANSAADAIDQMTQAFKENGAQGAAEAAGGIIANLVTGIAEKAPDVIDMAVKVIQAFVKGLKDNKDRLIEAAGEIVKALVDGLVSLLPNEIAQPIKKTFDGIGKSLKSGGLKKGIDAAVKMFKTLVKAIGQIIDKVGPALVKILDFIGENMNAIIPLITGAVTAFLTFKTVTAVINKVKAAQEALNAVSKANPYVLLATAIAGIVTALATWNSTFSPAAQAAQHLKESVENVGEACETGGQNIANMMQSINEAESIYGNYSDTLFATQEELSNMTTGIDAAQSGISEIYRRESEERNGYTESEIEALQNYYDTLQTLYEQQLDIEVKKQEAIQAGVDAEIASFSGSLAEYQQKQASWLQTAEESKNAQLDILAEQQATEIALYQQKAEAEGISAAETQAHVEEIIAAYDKQREQVADRYTQMVSSVNEKYEQMSGGYDEFIQTMNGLNSQYETEQTYHNQKMRGYDSANVEEYRKTMQSYLDAGYDSSNVEAAMYRDSENEKLRHSEAVAAINDQMYALLEDGNSSYVQNLIAFAGEVAANGGQITEKQSDMINALVSSWDTFPTDIQEKLVGYLQPAMAQMEAEYPAFKDSANMGPDEVRAAWQQLLEDNGAYDATISIYDKYASASTIGFQNLTGITQTAINEMLGQVKAGNENAADLAGQLTPNMVAAIVGSDMNHNLSTTMQEQSKGLIDGLASLPEGTRTAMANAVAPMLEELRTANPQLYDEMAANSNSILAAIIAVLDIHSPSRAVADLFRQVPAGAIEGLSEGEEEVSGKVSGLANSVLSVLTGSNLGGQAQAMTVNAMNAMNVSFQKGTVTAAKTVQNMVNQLRRIFQASNLQSIAKMEATKAGAGIASGIRSQQGAAVGAASGIINSAIKAIEDADAASRAFQVGANFGNGLKSGIASKTGEIAEQAADTVRQAIDAANAAQQAHSPARKTMPIGHNFDEGIAVGIEDMRPKVDKAAAQTMISAMDAATKKATLVQMRAAMDGVMQRAAVSMSLNRQQVPLSVQASAEPGEINQTVNIYQPVKSPVEMSREMKKTAKEMTWH